MQAITYEHDNQKAIAPLKTKNQYEPRRRSGMGA